MNLSFYAYDRPFVRKTVFLGLVFDVREETMKEQAVKAHLRKIEKLGLRYLKSPISTRNEVDTLLEMQTIENIWNITDKEEIEEDVLLALHFQWKHMLATNDVKAKIPISSFQQHQPFMENTHGITRAN